jgi:hypothetical protein
MPDHELTSFSFKRHDLSPDPGPRRGIFLRSDAARIEDGRLHVPLFLTYRVPETLRGSFLDLARAIVLHAECSDPGVLFAAALIDPSQTPPDYAPNHTGNPSGWGDPTCCVEGWINLTLSLATPGGAPRSALHLHASLLDHVTEVAVLEPDSEEAGA